MFQTVRGKAGLTHLGSIIGEFQVRGYLIAVWRRGDSGQNVLNTHLPIHGVGSGRPDSLLYWDVIMGALASQIPGVSIVCSTACLGADQRKHQSPASLAFVRGIHRWQVNSPAQKASNGEMHPLDDVIMSSIKVCIFKSNIIFIIYQHRKVLGIPQNMYKYINFKTHSNLRLNHKRFLTRRQQCIC